MYVHKKDLQTNNQFIVLYFPQWKQVANLIQKFDDQFNQKFSNIS